MSTFSDRWIAKAEERRQLIESGVCQIEYIQTTRGGKLHVIAPYDQAMISGASELGGKWLIRTNQWSFNARSLRLVVELCTKVYGEIQKRGFE